LTLVGYSVIVAASRENKVLGVVGIPEASVAEYRLCEDNLTVSGRLAAAEEDRLREYLGKLLLSGADTVTIDLDGVESITSSCVGSIVTIWIDLRAADRMLVLKASAAVHKILDISGLSVLLKSGDA
jgi:anti-anti-sigma factor